MKANLKIIGIVMLLFLFACKKEKQQIVCTCCTSVTNEAIINYVDPAGDGCGWTLTILQTPIPSPPEPMEIYSPNNLDSLYKVENLHVRITYRIEGNGYYCWLDFSRMETITILQIVKL